MTKQNNIMKKIFSTLVIAAVLAVPANAQSTLGDLLGGIGIGGGSTSAATTSTAASTISNVLSGLAGVVYSAQVSLNGTYTYNGIAVSVTSSEGGVLQNLAGTAVTSGLESKADEYLAKVGIKPGAMTWTFNPDDNTFSVNVGGVSIPGTYKVGDGEKTVTLTFGKSMKYFCLTGTLESAANGARMVFPVNKAMTLIKKIASVVGQSNSSVSALTSLADGYDNYRLGFKLVK